MKKTLVHAFIFLCGTFCLDGCRSQKTVKTDELVGWSIRICPEFTDASRIRFKVSGMVSEYRYESGSMEWRKKGRKRSDLITVPKELRNIENLNLLIRMSGGKQARLCVMFDNYVIKYIQVSKEETHRLNRHDRDSCPC